MRNYVPVRKAFSKPSRAKQSFRDECNINTIMKRYEKTGLISHASRYQGDYSDVSGGMDYHDAMNAVLKAREMFQTVPAKIRARFNNDPGEFISFCTDSKNQEELIKMGLAKDIRVKPVDVNVTNRTERNFSQGETDDDDISPGEIESSGKKRKK